MITFWEGQTGRCIRATGEGGEEFGIHILGLSVIIFMHQIIKLSQAVISTSVSVYLAQNKAGLLQYCNEDWISNTKVECLTIK